MNEDTGMEIKHNNSLITLHTGNMAVWRPIIFNFLFEFFMRSSGRQYLRRDGIPSFFAKVINAEEPVPGDGVLTLVDGLPNLFVVLRGDTDLLEHLVDALSFQVEPS